MKKILPLLLLIVLASGCNKEITNLYGDGAAKNIYYHQFAGDTERGDIGAPQVGNKYTLLGPGIIMGTPVTCKVSDGRWVSDDGKDVYAIQEFEEGVIINHAGATVRWEANKGGNGIDGVFIIIFGNNGGLNIAKNMIHIRCTRYGVATDIFYGGRSWNVNYMPFQSVLQLGRDYSLSFSVIDNTIYWTLDGAIQPPISSEDFVGKPGKVVCFEHFYNAGYPSNTISVREAWAKKTY